MSRVQFYVIDSVLKGDRSDRQRNLFPPLKLRLTAGAHQGRNGSVHHDMKISEMLTGCCCCVSLFVLFAFMLTCAFYFPIFLKED